MIDLNDPAIQPLRQHTADALHTAIRNARRDAVPAINLAMTMSPSNDPRAAAYTVSLGLWLRNVSTIGEVLAPWMTRTDMCPDCLLRNVEELFRAVMMHTIAEAMQGEKSEIPLEELVWDSIVLGDEDD